MGFIAISFATSLYLLTHIHIEQIQRSNLHFYRLPSDNRTTICSYHDVLDICDSKYQSNDRTLVTYDRLQGTFRSSVSSHALYMCIGRVDEYPFMAFSTTSYKGHFSELNCTSVSTFYHPMTISPLVISPLDVGEWEMPYQQSICVSMTQTLVSLQSEQVFTLVSQSRVASGSLRYWLNACGIDAVIVHQGYRERNTISHSNVSPCSVRMVSGLTTHQVNITQHSLLCIEDVLKLFARGGQIPLIFATMLGLPCVGERSKCFTTWETHVEELLSILVAYHNVYDIKASLEVRSMWIPKLVHASRPDHGVLNEMLTSLARADNHLSWSRYFEKCLFSWMDWFGEGVEMRELVGNILTLLNILEDEVVSPLGVVCSPGSIKYICTTESARKDLAELLEFLSSIRLPNAIARTRDSILSLSDVLRLWRHPSLLDSRSVAESHMRSRSEPTTVPSLPVSIVHVSVLVFVGDDDVNAATRVLQKWRERCPHCNLGCHFVVLPVEDGDIRESLLETEQWIDHMSVSLDLVMVLIGLDSLLATPFPDDGDNGVIPQIAIGESSFFRLTAPIVVAMDDAVGGPTFSPYAVCPANPRAFVGSHGEVRRMIRAVWEDPISAYSSQGVEVALKAYMCAHHELVRIDKIKRFFNFNEDTIHQSVPYDEIHFSDEVVQWSDFDTNDEVIVETVIDEVFRLASANRLYDGVDLLLHLILLSSERIAERASSLIFEMARKLKYHSSQVSVQEKLELVRRLQGVYFGFDSEERTQLRESIMLALASYIDAIYFDLGYVRESAEWFARGVSSPPYKLVSSERSNWLSARSRLNRDAEGKHVVHIYSVASESTPELENLKFTAYMSGVEINVIGLGRVYKDYTQKIVWYRDHILGDSSIRDNDILMMIDAYDVVLTPAIRRIGKAFENAPTPIVACAEYGIYPEPGGPWHYYRGDGFGMKDSTLGTGTARFLNSGCIIGRAKEVKLFLEDVYEDMLVIRDDQQVFVRYMLRHPQRLSIDVGNTMFHCGYKETHLSLNRIFLNGSTEFDNLYHPVALFHLNNRISLNLYNSLVGAYQQFYSLIFSGPEGQYFLQAMHHLWDGRPQRAKNTVRQVKIESGNATEEVVGFRQTFKDYILSYT